MGEKITEMELDKTLKALDEVKESSEELKMMSELEDQRDSEELKKSIAEEPKSEKIMVEKDLLTGQMKQIGKVDEIKIEKKESVFSADDCLNEEIPENMDDIKISDEAIRAQLKDDIKSISDEDVIVLTNIIQRYRNKENFKVYDELPPKVKGMITKQLADSGIPFNKEVVNAASEALISNIISGIAIDQYQVEFDEAMSEIMNEELPEVAHYVVESFNKRVKILRDKAKELEDAGEIEKAETINKIANSCEDSYEFTTFKEALRTHKIKIKKFDIEKHKRIFEEFDLKYKDSPYKIRSVSCIPAVLNRVLSIKDYRTEHLIAFTVAFCKLCMNYKPTNPEQHSFMYYTIQSIMYLDINSDDEDFDNFKKTIIENIKECIDILDSDYNNVIYN